MIRQSKHNRSDSQVSEFQKTMLNKLDSLCSPSPTFDSLDSEVSSLFDSTNKSANLRRRRLYNSPGTVGVLQSPAGDPGAAAREARDAQRKSIGNILAERARLVQRTLTRNALASQQSSTPVRPAPSSRINALGTADHPKTTRAVQNDSAPVTKSTGIRSAIREEISDNFILGSLTTLESTDANLGLREPVVETFDSDSCRHGRATQARLNESVDTRESSTLNTSKRRRIKSPGAHEDSLSLTAFSTKRKRNDRNVQWLPEFIEHIAQLVQAAEKCALHKRAVRSALKEKKPRKRSGQSFLDEENMKKLVGWLQDSRTLLMERLARNIHRLL